MSLPSTVLGVFPVKMQHTQPVSTYSPLWAIERFLLMVICASYTFCHFTSLQHQLYRLSEEEAEAIFVQS